MTTDDITGLLAAWHDGDRQAFDALVPRVYAELRRQAARLMAGERAATTMQATALVHEAVLRLMGWDGVAWKSRRQFLAVSSQVMRHVLVDLARRRKASKRGDGEVPVPVAEDTLIAPAPDLALLALDRALDALAAHDARKARVVECRFFAGLSIDETAEALGDLSPHRAERVDVRAGVAVPRAGARHRMSSGATWNRVADLFTQALAVDEDGRAAWLARACGDDGALRAELDALLASHQRNSGVLDVAALEGVARPLASDLLTLRAGEAVGPYRIRALLGVGGMGEVYDADDERLGRRVAIKVLPSWGSDPDRVWRFEREARALAALAHPNVVTVFDVGVEGTTPYLVTERLEGETVRQRLRPWAVLAEARRVDRATGRQRAGGRPRGRHRPPRPQAREPVPDRAARHRADSRLRPRQAARPVGRTAWRGRRRRRVAKPWRGRCSGRRRTWRRSRSAATPSTAAPISSRLAPSHTSC